MAAIQTALDPALADSMRSGLRRLARSVTVVSCTEGESRFAMTATAVSELSLSPPAMLVCVNQSAAMHRALSNGVQFCLNVLSRNQEEVSALCAGKANGEKRFQHDEWRYLASGTPYLEGAEAVFICRQCARLPFGTHDIFIGEVEQVIVSERPDPLLYVDGRYASLAITS